VFLLKNIYIVNKHVLLQIELKTNCHKQCSNQFDLWITQLPRKRKWLQIIESPNNRNANLNIFVSTLFIPQILKQQYFEMFSVNKVTLIEDDNY
jgi:hypothetical protein